MKVLITGSSGMVGNLVLENCLQSEKISEVCSLVRSPLKILHPKLTEVVIKNYEDYSEHFNLFRNINVGFFCIGAYSGQVPDEQLKKITVNYAVKFAEALKKESPEATLCLLSGAGADRSEKSKTPFAHYKGMAENQIAKLNLNFYSFRPGYIYPVTPRNEPNLMYRIIRILYPSLKFLGNRFSIKSTELAKAMFNVGIGGAEKEVLENKDIVKYS